MTRVLLVVFALALAGMGVWLLSAPGADHGTETPAAASLEAAPSSATLTAPGAAVAPPNSAAGAESERTEIASVPEPVAGAGEGTIVGTVKWSTGEPLVDVEVRAQTDHSLQHAIRAGRVRTDAQGRYTLRVGVGSWLVLTAFGPGPERARVERERETTVNLVYARGPEVVGVVRDEHGQSVPQAEIWVGSGYGHELPRRLGVADAQGNFRVAVTRERHWLGARARGYRGSPLQMVEASDAKERRLELILVRNDARVRGFVRDPRGQPVADAAVLAVPVGGPGWRARPDGVPVLDATLVTGTTDAQGAFALEGLAPGALRVQAGARGLGVARTEVQVAAGAVGEVTLDLPPAVRVEGSVRDALGRPVARAQVVFANEWPSFALRSAATATDGTYGIDAVSAGDVRVEVRVDARAVLANQLTLTADPVQVWDAVIPAAVELSGRVVDTLQQPLVGYWVAAFRSDNEAGDALANPLGQATTDAQGKFTLANLEAVPLQVRVGIAASSARRGTRLTVLIENGVQPPRTDLLLTVPDDKLPSAGVRGRVFRPDGAPLAQARVQLGNSEQAGFADTETDAQGAFDSSGLLPGNYWVSVHHRDYPTLFVGQKDVAARAVVELGELRMVDGGRVVVVPVPGAGVTAGDLQVEALDDRGRGLGAFERVGDALRSGMLPAGELTLLVSGAKIARARRAFTVQGGTELRVELVVEPGLRRVVRAELPAGTPTPRWIWYSLFQGRELLGSGNLARGPDGIWSAEVWLGAQDCELMVGADNRALRGQAALSAGLPDGAVVSVALAPK